MFWRDVNTEIYYGEHEEVVTEEYVSGGDGSVYERNDGVLISRRSRD